MECGGCTLCCELFPVKELKKPANINCQFCVVKEGCSIHEDRPNACRDFFCAYAQSPNVPIELRPDKSNVIFEKMSDQLFIGTLDARYELTDFAMGQINSFIKQGFSVILGASDFRKPKVFIASGHNIEEILNNGDIRDRLNYNS